MQIQKSDLIELIKTQMFIGRISYHGKSDKEIDQLGARVDGMLKAILSITGCQTVGEAMAAAGITDADLYGLTAGNVQVGTKIVYDSGVYEITEKSWEDMGDGWLTLTLRNAEYSFKVDMPETSTLTAGN